MTSEQGERLIVAAEGIHQALLALVGLLVPAQDDAPACLHPIDARIDQSAMGQPPFTDYHCTACAQRIVDGVAA